MFSWTPENVEQLKALAAENLSTREIANALGTGRNSVIGKCNRENINLQFRRVGSPDRPRRERRVRVFKPRSLTPEAAPMPVEPLFIPLIDLEPHHCREVVSQGSAIESCGVIGSFCGHTVKKGSSYCPFHHAINWTPAPARVRPFIRTPVRASA